MCTISWFYDGSDYHVFFNRDEQVLRPRAISPKVYSLQNQINKDLSIDAIMPLDPLGGGTWFAVNEYGLSFALLNFYQGRLPKGKLKSRGLIVKDCAAFSSLEQLEAYWSEQNLAKFSPFTLLCFAPGLASDTEPFPEKPKSIISYCWNGRTLDKDKKSSPFFSSAINFDDVCASRENIYSTMLAKNGGENLELLHNQIHASHLPSKGAKSICMHREDAQTVSFSSVCIKDKEILFKYHDGPACEPHDVCQLDLRRKILGD